MAVVKCDIEESSEPNDYGTETDCVIAICSKCGHEVMSYGVTDDSIRRCLAVMREECPRGEKNFYIEDDSKYDHRYDD